MLFAKLFLVSLCSSVFGAFSDPAGNVRTPFENAANALKLVSNPSIELRLANERTMFQAQDLLFVHNLVTLRTSHPVVYKKLRDLLKVDLTSAEKENLINKTLVPGILKYWPAIKNSMDSEPGQLRRELTAAAKRQDRYGNSATMTSSMDLVYDHFKLEELDSKRLENLNAEDNVFTRLEAGNNVLNDRMTAEDRLNNELQVYVAGGLELFRDVETISRIESLKTRFEELQIKLSETEKYNIVEHLASKIKQYNPVPTRKLDDDLESFQLSTAHQGNGLDRNGVSVPNGGLTLVYYCFKLDQLNKERFEVLKAEYNVFERFEAGSRALLITYPSGATLEQKLENERQIFIAGDLELVEDLNKVMRVAALKSRFKTRFEIALTPEQKEDIKKDLKSDISKHWALVSQAYVSDHEISLNSTLKKIGGINLVYNLWKLNELSDASEFATYIGKTDDKKGDAKDTNGSISWSVNLGLVAGIMALGVNM